MLLCGYLSRSLGLWTPPRRLALAALLVAGRLAGMLRSSGRRLRRAVMASGPERRGGARA